VRESSSWSRTLGVTYAIPATREMGCLQEIHLTLPNISRRAQQRVVLEYARRRQGFVHLDPGTHKNHSAGIQDNTHLSVQGATQVASLVAAELQKTHLNLVCE